MDVYPAIVIPGSMDWERWTAAGSTTMSAESNMEAGGLLCYPAASAQSIPLWVGTTDEEKLDGIVSMELEQRRLDTGAPGRHWDYRIVDRRNSRAQLEVTVLEGTPPFPESGKRWGAFDLSLRHYPLPADQIILLRETRGLLAIFSKGPELCCHHALGAEDLDEDLIQELQCVFMELRQKDLMRDLSGITLWDVELEPSLRDALKDRLRTSLRDATRPQPQLERRWTPRYLPHTVALARSAATIQRRWVMGAVSAFSLVAVLSLLALVHLTLLKKGNQTLEQRIVSMEPASTQVHEARERWRSLEPAIDPDYYPVEVIHQVAIALPDRTARLKHLELDGGELHILIEAVKATTAAAMRSDLLDPEKGILEGWQWTSSPPPATQASGRAELRMSAQKNPNDEETTNTP